MKHIQALEDFYQTFDLYEELDSDDFYVECGCFHGFYDDHSEEFTDEEDELYWKVDGLIDVAERYFRPILLEEEREQELEERRYEVSKGYR